MKKITTIILLILTIAACKKNVIKTHPNLVGKWREISWCPVDIGYAGLKSMNVESNGKGEFFESYQYGDNASFKGKVKTDGNDLYFGGQFVFTIIEIVDTSGYVENPTPPSFCSSDLIYVKGLLRVKANSGLVQTYYRI